MKKLIVAIFACSVLLGACGTCCAKEYPVSTSTLNGLKALVEDQATYTSNLQQRVIQDMASVEAGEIAVVIGKSMELTVVNAALSSLYKMLQMEQSHGDKNQFDPAAVDIIKQYIANIGTYIDGAAKSCEGLALKCGDLNSKFAQTPEFLNRDKEHLNKILAELGQ